MLDVGLSVAYYVPGMVLYFYCYVLALRGTSAGTKSTACRHQRKRASPTHFFHAVTSEKNSRKNMQPIKGMKRVLNTHCTVVR